MFSVKLINIWLIVLIGNPAISILFFSQKENILKSIKFYYKQKWIKNFLLFNHSNLNSPILSTWFNKLNRMLIEWKGMPYLQLKKLNSLWRILSNIRIVWKKRRLATHYISTFQEQKVKIINRILLRRNLKV